MNKDQSKRAWLRSGLPTAPHEVVRSVIDIPGAVSRIGAPCVVKPIDSGSSIDVFICKTTADAEDRARHVISRNSGAAMVERFIRGTELTIGILEERALSPIRITTSHEFFDYQAKYVGNDAQHHFDLKLPDHVVAEVKQIALRAHQAIGCRDLSRVDVIVDADHRPWLLEINTMPGFTPRSLLPEMAAHEGVSFAKLVDRLVCRAYSRGAGAQRQAV